MRRRALAALAALLCALALAGCAALQGVLDTQEALEEAGYRDAGVTWSSTNGYTSVTVTWQAMSEGEALGAESLAVAGIVWRELPIAFDVLYAEPSGEAVDVFGPGRVFQRAELEAEFGPRPAGLDKSAGDAFNVRAILYGVGAAVVVGLVLIVVIAVILVRHGRRKRAPAAGGPGWPQAQWPPPQPGWPPPGGWPQQPPPAWPPQGGPPAPPPTLAAPGAPPAPGADPWQTPER